MADKLPNALSFDRLVGKEEIAFAYELLAGIRGASEAELNSATHIANTFQHSRLELLRRIVSTPEYIIGSRDILPILLDQALRRRVFGGAEIPKVNTFCIGAPRCGTTTLSVLLGENEDIYCSPIKETNFFSHLWEGASKQGLPIAMYELYYYGWNGQRVLTDFSPLYLRNKHAIDGIHQYNPSAKIIACLRDPVERAISAFFYTKEFHKQNDVVEYFLPCLSKFSLEVSSEEIWYSPASLLRQSFYSSDLGYVSKLFNNVLLINFEEFEEMESLNRRVCGFLGVDPRVGSRTSSSSQKINASAKEDDGKLVEARRVLGDFFHEELLGMQKSFGLEFQAK